MAYKRNKLKPSQMRAIGLLLEKGERAGAIKETAKEVGLSRPETIWRWKQDPLFVSEYERQRAVYEAGMSQEVLASKRRRVQLLTREIEAIRANREESEGVSPGEFAATSKAIGGLVKQIAEEMGPLEPPEPANIALTQNNLNVTLAAMTTEQLKALDAVMKRPELAVLKPLLLPLMADQASKAVSVA
ncbi:MAG: phBC6A51 family helix-turn-helix protein [Chloroflexi bacterium]|nr:phBC6A51 family helix-turn-helix protein [Chloroflexota bacterium]